MNEEYIKELIERNIRLERENSAYKTKLNMLRNYTKVSGIDWEDFGKSIIVLIKNS